MNEERPGAAVPSPNPDLDARSDDAADDLAADSGGGLFGALLQLQQATAAADALEQRPAAEPPDAIHACPPTTSGDAHPDSR